MWFRLKYRFHMSNEKQLLLLSFSFETSFYCLLIILFWFVIEIVAAKLVPVGYGIKKLQIMLTIVDDLVSVDSLIEEHLTVEPCSEHVQSCDIVAFNKI